MNNIKSIRPFIGAKDFNLSREFYKEIGFEEIVIDSSMSLFQMGCFGFYLQRYYVKDWVDNTMLFLEVDDVESYYKHVLSLNLLTTFKDVKLKTIVYLDWGKEFFLHDPSNILWHIGQFN